MGRVVETPVVESEYRERVLDFDALYFTSHDFGRRRLMSREHLAKLKFWETFTTNSSVVSITLRDSAIVYSNVKLVAVDPSLSTIIFVDEHFKRFSVELSRVFSIL